MSLLIFLTVLQAVIATLLVVVILMQQSEGGGLGVGGSPAGLMSARGAADFMTRFTTILATLFVALSIVLAALASVSGSERAIEDTLNRSAVPAAPADPLSGGAVPIAPAPSVSATPASGGLDPLSAPVKQ